jgi:predicted NAD/FAD-dependent oxidoreductase
MTEKVGIIGAGVSGLTLGTQLKAKGFQVEIFDKGRAVGGRASSRRTDWGYLDHGAQFLTIRDSEFHRFLATHLPHACLSPWEVNFARLANNQMTSETLETLRYVPRQSMSTLCRELAANLLVRTQVKICQLSRGNRWMLQGDDGNHYGPFDRVVITAPPAQTAELIRHHSDLAEAIARIQMWPCWTLMLITPNAIPVPFGGIKCNHPVLGWIGLNHTKPGRGELASLVIQANWEWSTETLEKERDVVGEILQEAAEQVLGLNLGDFNYKATHLWRYAAPIEVAPQPYFLDPENHLAACGDWCVAGRIEGAFLSANALSKQMIQSGSLN